ncbi:DNA repair protein [Halorhabdus tiamatea SARL4B]|uniref:DNA 3'-5' helicase n=1 Tax=Halorhabdus tiamatea SARL4B TaxID=1033806 RepID=F7PMX4_9EURY|nr:DEAD/DEAH box helicase family protein [Halorhabdus tiamatea]ERJ07681.1 DNA repair protein [Halorhabdus tiamatea SARL4B]CCQ32661.1 DNA helicase (Rad25 homolog) [Halorhabdus tiamatea SARL4B]
MERVTLRYEDGTIRIDGLDAETAESLSNAERDERSKTWRAPGFRYSAVRDAIEATGAAIDDEILDLSTLDLDSAYELRSYQQEALDAWREAGDRGVLELPTGSGKTVIGIAAIEALGTPTLVVVPTIDLLEQWRGELQREFDVPIGQLGGGTQRLEAVTVATYKSAYLRAGEIGDRFGLVIFDEVHHLGGEGYRDIARLLVAPARLGLTATFERPDGAHEIVADLIGEVVYRLDPEELAGEHLAPYDVKRLEVPLTDDERAAYERDQETFTDYLARSDIDMQSGADYRQLVIRSGTDPAAREALLAKQRARSIVRTAERKVDVLAELLDRHADDRVLVFTASTDFVYRLSERFLRPAITHETATDERTEILRGFRTGAYSTVITANVLDEGIDVPDANVAILLAGSGSQREFTQRLGRILRPTEDGGRALLYEVVCADTAEERVASRRR